MHGGGPGSGAPKWYENAFKHGFYSAKAIEDGRRLRELLRAGRKLLEQFEKPSGVPLSPDYLTGFLADLAKAEATMAFRSSCFGRQPSVSSRRLASAISSGGSPSRRRWSRETRADTGEVDGRN